MSIDVDRAPRGPTHAPASGPQRSRKQRLTAPTADPTTRPDQSHHAATQEQLAEESFRVALGLMEKHGNTLSPAHVEALRQLASLLARSAFEPVGRVAVGLGTGLGKTTSVAAFVAALHRLGLDSVAVSVSSSQVEHLCDFRRQLTDELRVSEELIGLRHSKHDASIDSDDMDGRYQLVTHARARSRRDHHVRLVTQHEGSPRQVIVWDESLIRADSEALPLLGILEALDATARHQRTAEQGCALDLALRYLAECRPMLEGAEELKADGIGVPLMLPNRSGAELEAYQDALRGCMSVGNAAALCDLLQLAQSPLRLMVTAEGRAVLWAEVAVPPELQDVVILDASYRVRRLCQLDPTIREETVAPDDVKTWERVEVAQVNARGSRSAITEGLKVNKAKAQYVGPAAAEVADILRECLTDATARVLVFTYKDRKGDHIKPATRLKAQIHSLLRTAEERKALKRVQWETWGNELGVNRYRDVTHIVLAGVILRDLGDLAAAARGQAGDLDHPTPHAVLEELRESEAAASAYQALSRGRCRQVDSGSALPMRVYIVHRDVGLEGRLRAVMPGVRWSYREPRHMPTANRGGVSKTLEVWLRHYLRELSQHIRQVSTKQLRDALPAHLADVSSPTLTKVVDTIARDPEAGWTKEGRSLARADVQHYFGATELDNATAV